MRLPTRLTAAVDDVVDTKIASGHERIDRSAAITQHAAGRTHDQTLHVTETSDQRVSQSDAEIFVASVFPGGLRILNGSTAIDS